METGGTISLKKAGAEKMCDAVSCPACVLLYRSSPCVLTEVRGNLVSADSSASISWDVCLPLIQWYGIVFFQSAWYGALLWF